MIELNTQEIASFFVQMEGPYKWYVLASVAVGITAVVTHFIFRTLKWFLLIAALGFIIFYVWSKIYAQIPPTTSEQLDSINTFNEINSPSPAQK